MLQFDPSRSASRHFGWYSFSIHRGQEDELAWVAGYIQNKDGHPSHSQYQPTDRPSTGAVWQGIEVDEDEV